MSQPLFFCIFVKGSNSQGGCSLRSEPIAMQLLGSSCSAKKDTKATMLTKTAM